ncbi:hypothetical protein Hanom_Chr16g01478561 [Helianthus anomalus]
MVTSLKLPSNSWLVFQFEEALSSFRLIYFHQDISLAPSEYFYYQPGNLKDRDNCMVLIKFKLHLFNILSDICLTSELLYVFCISCVVCE